LYHAKAIIATMTIIAPKTPLTIPPAGEAERDWAPTAGMTEVRVVEVIIVL
jgi:hypothetical protein